MISTILIGLGNIGQLYDYDLPSGEFKLTHGQALTEDSRFNLVAGIDIDPCLRKKFENKFDKPTFSKLVELNNLYNPELVIIATPAETHEEVILEVLEYIRPQAILCEKPLSYEIEKSERIVKECSELGVSLYVNFIRRTDPAVAQLKSIINQSKTCNAFSGVCWYSSGLYNTCSHFVDLFQFLFGQPTSWTVRKKLKQNVLPFDFQMDFNLSFSDGDIEFKSVPNENLFYNRFELILPSVVAIYQQNGDVSLSPIEKNMTKLNRNIVSDNAVLCPGNMKIYQENIYNAVFDAMNGRKNWLSTGFDALSIARIFDDLTKRG